MREGWKSSSLGDSLCLIRNGISCKQSKEGLGSKITRIQTIADTQVDPNKVGYADLSEAESKRYRLEIGDILFSHINSPTHVGKTAYVDKDYGLVHGMNLLCFRASQDIDPRFLEYYLKNLYWSGFWKKVCKQSVNQASVNQQDIKKIPFAYPPLPEQKRIVAILDEAFAGIDTAVANTEKNLANARELFESYLNSVFSQRGEGWEIRRVGEVADHCLGKMLDKQKNKGVMKPYLRNINVQWFEINTSDMLQMRIEEHEKSRYSVQQGDLLICEGGYPGRAAIWNRAESVFFQKALHRVRCEDQRYNRWLLYYLYLLDSNGDLSKFFTGAGIQHFTGKALKQLQLPWPPQSSLNDLLKGIEGIKDEVETLESIYQQKLTALTELKQSLLQKAFAGELTSDAQDEVKAALA